MKEFEKHEKHVQDMLGLDATVASGSKFYDPGDAVDRNHYLDQSFRLWAEAKCTEQKSYSLKRDNIAAWVRRAQLEGKKFCMPVRFIENNCYTDYIVLTLDDFIEIYWGARDG